MLGCFQNSWPVQQVGCLPEKVIPESEESRRYEWRRVSSVQVGIYTRTIHVCIACIGCTLCRVVANGRDVE